jgi:UrcA family protein
MSAKASRICALMMAAVGSTAAAGWPAHARAEHAPVVRSVRVYVGDLHPGRAADVATLYARIRTAAETACGEPRLPESRFIDPRYRRCVEAAVREAVARVDSPPLSAYYRRHTNRERG